MMYKILLPSLCIILLSWYISTIFRTYRPRLAHPPSPLHYTVTEEQLQALHRDGAVHLHSVLSPAWLEYMELVVEDRVNNPWIWNIAVKMLDVYEYYQFDNWMVSPGFLDYLTTGPAISIARSVFPTWSTIRVLKETLFYKPRAVYPALLTPLHVDCESGGHGCPDYPAFRLWVTLDKVERGKGIVFQKGTHDNVEEREKAKALGCPSNAESPEYFSFEMEPGDGLVWFGDTVHFAYGGNRRVLSMCLIEGETSRFEDNKKPHINWDWIDHGIKEGDLIQGPYFPQIYPSLNSSETQAREQRSIAYFSASWENFYPFIRNKLSGLGWGRAKQPGCNFAVDPAAITVA